MSGTTVATVRKMTVTDQFTIVPNELLRGELPKPLRALARCILLHLLSLPEGWRISRVKLDQSFLEGDTAIKNALRELRDAGYLVQEQSRTPAGMWSWSWHVTDDPVRRPLPQPADQAALFETAGQTTGGLPADGEPAAGNRPIKEEDGSKKTDLSRRKPDGSDAEDQLDDAQDEPRPDVEQLCERLADKIAANGAKRPTITKKWRTDARLLLDRDHRPLDEALRLIDWCQADQFWRPNIMSIPKFREKYDQLRLRAINGGWKPKAPSRERRVVTEAWS